MTIAKSIASVVRRRMLAQVKASGGKTRAVALSGGVDSCSILAAFLELGDHPQVVSYTPSTHLSTDYTMARAAARTHGLPFVPAVVDMSPEALERDVRAVVAEGYFGKVEVECLVPMLTVLRVARDAGAQVVFTGDQADGFFNNNKWSSHNADRAAGIPRGERTNVQQDTTPERIDGLRQRYWELDKSCSGGVRRLGERVGVAVAVPYRDEKIRAAFHGSLWSDVNRPRIKEPLRLAFPALDVTIPTRKLPVNLHKGDSLFAVTLGSTLMAQPHLRGPWRTPRGLYAAIARGEV